MNKTLVNIRIKKFHLKNSMNKPSCRSKGGFHVSKNLQAICAGQLFLGPSFKIIIDSSQIICTSVFYAIKWLESHGYRGRMDTVNLNLETLYPHTRQYNYASTS